MTSVSCPSLSVPPWATLDYHLRQSSSFLKFLYEKSSTCLARIWGDGRHLVGPKDGWSGAWQTWPILPTLGQWGRSRGYENVMKKIPHTKSAGSAARNLPSTSGLLLIRQIDYGMCRTILVFSSINRAAVFKKKKKLDKYAEIKGRVGILTFNAKILCQI